jgi:hypothetical protein
LAVVVEVVAMILAEHLLLLVEVVVEVADNMLEH